MKPHPFDAALVRKLNNRGLPGGVEPMIKPQGEVSHSQTPQNVAGTPFLKVEGVHIGAWTPRPDGQPPLEQVHLLIHIEGFPHPVTMRFKSPDTLGWLIEELIRYRHYVWPDAAPVNPQAKVDDSPNIEETNQ
jgi:hypothetical protein